MKKVLFVIETLRGGGAERALSNITTHFPRNWQIDILVNDKSLIEYPYRGNILSLSRPEKKSAVYYISNIIRRIFYLKKIKRENGYEACVSFLDSANISNVLSGNKYCKTIVSIRNNMMADKSGLTEKAGTLPLTKILYVRADKIITVSKEIEIELIRRLNISEDKVKAIVNGYDCDEIRKKMEIPTSNKEKVQKFIGHKWKIIVTVGRVVDQKGQWHLIRAFSNVVKEEPYTALFIIGDGPLTGYLAELIHTYELEEKVMLIGHSDNPFWYEANADIFVLPSLYEGYPNALAEAICCGLPCIAADVHSGVREILAPHLGVMGERADDVIEEEFGVLVPVCSGTKLKGGKSLEPEELKMAEAIVTLLRDDKKREYYRQKSMERSRELDIDRKVEQWIGVISDNNNG